MADIKIYNSGVIYENPLPQLRSRNAYFPGIQQLPDGSILAAYVIGEAFESADQTTHLAKSFDLGETWQQIGPIYDKSRNNILVSSTLKIAYAGQNRLIASGYEFFRDNPELPIGNAETGGVLNDRVVFLISEDLGKTWSRPKVVTTSFQGPVEASSPVIVLKDHSWVSPITNFPDWDGKVKEGFYGRLLRSDDQGRTWNDAAVTMEFTERKVTIYEQRLCQLQESGVLVVIAWNEDVEKGKQLCNHYSLSYDNGYSFSEPKPTGIMGQTSSVLPIGDGMVLSLHCIRRNTARPGIYGYVVNLSEGNWDIEHESVIWEPSHRMTKDEKMAEVFSFLKFGQPSAIRLSDGSCLMTHWVIEDGQGKVLWTKFNVCL